WLSVEDGWAQLVHRDGYRINVGGDSFVQVTDDYLEDGKPAGDHLTLYRGQVYAQAERGTGTGELRVVTPHARARIRLGRAIVVFSRSEEETQLVCLEREA